MPNANSIEPKRGFFARLWQNFLLFGEAMEMTEASLLAERVTVLERELGELRRSGMSGN